MRPHGGPVGSGVISRSLQTLVIRFPVIVLSESDERATEMRLGWGTRSPVIDARASPVTRTQSQKFDRLFGSYRYPALSTASCRPYNSDLKGVTP